jgi:Protein of unknown function (DUF3017)
VRHAASASAGRRRKRDKARDPRPTEEGAAAHAAGRPGASASGRLAGLLPYLMVVGGTVLSLLVMRQGERDVRGGTLVLAGVLLAAAVARLALPDRRAGLLASRRRLADVAAFAALGLGLLVAGLFFPVPV